MYSFFTSITLIVLQMIQINDLKNYYNHDTGTKLGHLNVVSDKNINLLFFFLITSESKKTCTNRSSDTLLRFVQIFLTQTL